uniref:(California timema) hypothetical protein n=1 Tax=Timema californicum TaxID=61474 RepID=A0A7R9PCJ5_TIMCA|nr:unnamed protein product [Timema californicum]
MTPCLRFLTSMGSKKPFTPAPPRYSKRALPRFLLLESKLKLSNDSEKAVSEAGLFDSFVSSFSNAVNTAAETASNASTSVQSSMSSAFSNASSVINATTANSTSTS